MRNALVPLAVTVALSLSIQATSHANESLAQSKQEHVHITDGPCPSCDAQRAQQIARLRYLLYYRSGHRLEMQRLDAEIRLVTEQLRTAEKLHANYSRLNGYWTKHSRPFPVTEERTRLSVVELEGRLKLLRRERLHAIQNHKLQVRLRQLEIAQLVAALRNPISVSTL